MRITVYITEAHHRTNDNRSLMSLRCAFPSLTHFGYHTFSQPPLLPLLHACASSLSFNSSLDFAYSRSLFALPPSAASDIQLYQLT